MAIHFFTEDIRFQLPNKLTRKRWLKEIASGEGFKIIELNYIFCSDEYLHQINVDYLNHDTLTDIITFDNSDEKGKIEGDIFISIDRVFDNAKTHHSSNEDELSRVISHGLLHLMGYKDKKKEDASLMRSKENLAIDLFHKINVPRGTGN
ncbi:MAG: rRNA maturation RNase YbeY [Algoriphagus sp.]|uniref:rRNA maturation RNase YbeY n=1 Tax=Algoriphagus sp. TaxID=1872435 RepID=UPI0017B07008|nr:rRNA maturation RNase YbeY [Algoriphagus sp.]NVJ87508.1 rRNA maturation RNase YbeY [Algoriphagus sp.]